jgi:hypothetical protein
VALRSWIPYKFLVDVYRKSVDFDDSGQSIETWMKDRTIKVNYMPSRGEERLVGRVQNPRSYTLWSDDPDLSVDDQLRDLRDVQGNLIETGRMNVISVKRFPMLGKVHHIEVNAQVILE